MACTSSRCAATMVANESAILSTWFMRPFSASTFKKLAVMSEYPNFFTMDATCAFGHPSRSRQGEGLGRRSVT